MNQLYKRLIENCYNPPCMGLLNELKNMLKTAGEQISSSSKTTSTEIGFTTKFHAQAKSLGLTEADAEDVYYHGEIDRWNKYKMRKSYGSYEIGIYYFLSKRTGQPVISFIWKK
jgi:hypothetical protein